jgi:uncharacterized lipoprotein YmbA
MLLWCVQEDELELNRVEARIVELSSATDLTQQEQPEQEVPEHEWAAEQSDVLEQEVSEQHEPEQPEWIMEEQPAGEKRHIDETVQLHTQALEVRLA